MSEHMEPTCVDKPASFILEGISQTMYYKSKDLQAYDPVFYYGCKTKPRNILVKKSIPSTEYLYANFNARSNSWVLSTEECKKAILLISNRWVETNMSSMKDDRKSNIIDTGTKDTLNPISPDVIAYPENTDDRDISCNEVRENITNLIQKIKNAVSENISGISETPLSIGGEECISPAHKEYEMAPPVLDLDEKEMFRDVDGNAVFIETRGTKDRKGIRFKVKDVMTAFKMPNLDCTLRNEHNQYTTDHYNVYFIQGKQFQELSPQIKKEQYLTYKGILRVLFASNSKTAEKFQDWAEDTLFTVQMGTKDAKVKLGTDLLNITPKTYKAVFDTYATTFPCIYLLRLATVKEVRTTFGIAPDIADDLVVYKYGFTEDLSRRIKEHSSGYGKMPGVSIRLGTFHVIDPKYTSHAEGDVREFVETFQKRLQVDGHNELVALTDKEMNFVKKQYASIGSRYAGATAELTAQIAELKTRIKELENELMIERLNHSNAMQKEQYEKKLVEMQRDLGAEIFKAKEANYISQANSYKLELQLIKQS
jgi:hypothetical protein